MPPVHRNYDPELIQVSFKGVPLRGFIKGTFLEGARSEDSFVLEAGAGGDSAFVRQRNYTGMVKLTIMQTAPTNDYLAGIAELDELFGEGEGELFVEDLNGTTNILDQNARIMKMADVTFSNGLEGREWTFGCPQMSIFTGGSVS